MVSRVVVTGAFGYIGLALTARLVRTHRVVAVGHPPRAKAGLPHGVETRYGELAIAHEALDRDTALVHLAGGGGEGKCREDPVAAVRSIVRGTIGIVEAARRAGVPRMLYASTIAVYGTHRDHGRPYRESDEALSDDLYGSLKEAAERVCTGAGGTALRIANVYGEGSGVDVGIQGVAERFARAAARGEELSLYGDGSQRMDMVHVDDVVDAFVRALEAASLPPALNIGGGAPCTVAELAGAAVRAGEALGAHPRLTKRPAPEGKIWPARSLEIGLAGSTLGWRPRVGLEDGMDGLVQMMHRAAAAAAEEATVR